MNIALIIFPIHASHGCILQTFALATTLRQMGHTVTIIDRQWDKPTFYHVCRHAVRILINRITRGISGGLTEASNIKVIMSELRTFVDKYLDDRIILYSTPNYNELKSYEAFVIGSDQTWRPRYVSDVTYYYLGFVPRDAKVKRVAYAPSFGTDKWEYSPELTAKCKELINRFDAVSVREITGVELCREYYDLDAKHVLDPTMLLTKEDYLIASDLDMRDDHLLSYYILDKSESKMAIVRKVCTELNLHANQINTETENNNAPLCDRIAPSIEKWIGGFAHSKFVVADSFHATVFAIIFNRPFITIANPERGQSRFVSLLSKFGLQNRMIYNVDGITDELIHTPIDWHNVNRILNKEKQLSKEFLMNSI